MSNAKTVSWLSAAMMAASLSPVRADDFYRGKTVEVLVGFSPGGGYDAYGRALASVIGKYIPGRPTVVVRNMTGAGSLTLATYLQSAAPRDGLTFGIFDDGLLIAPLIKPETVRLNPSKLTWIGSTAKDQQVCMIWSQSPVKKVEDLRGAQTVFGVTGLDDIRYMSTAMLRNVIGGNVKIIPGYPGSADIRLAVEKKELDGVCDSWQSVKGTKADWINEKKITVLVQMGLKSHPDLVGVPLVGDFAEKPSDRAALAMLVAPSESGRAFAAPPDTPADRLQALRRAFDQSVKDSEFLAITSKANLEVDPLTGEEVEGYIKQIYATSETDIQRAREMVK